MIRFRLLVLLKVLHQAMLRTFPVEFRAEFGEEMAELFGERQVEVEEQGR